MTQVVTVPLYSSRVKNAKKGGGDFEDEDAADFDVVPANGPGHAQPGRSSRPANMKGAVGNVLSYAMDEKRCVLIDAAQLSVKPCTSTEFLMFCSVFGCLLRCMGACMAGGQRLVARSVWQ